MRTPEEIKADLDEWHLELEEAQKQYKAFIATIIQAAKEHSRPISMKEVRPVHDRITKARVRIQGLKRELGRAKKQLGLK